MIFDHTDKKSFSWGLSTPKPPAFFPKEKKLHIYTKQA